tara:strand:- start:289 stop:867 length:579 start_codon:yes stop_codon:yes gene_type:complete
MRKSQYNENKIREFGERYNDRTSSYDDIEDLDHFIWLSKTDDRIQRMLHLRHFPDYSGGNLQWVKHPYGQYDVDLGLKNDKTDEFLVVFDTERRWRWGEDWPHYFGSIHFLDRKTKFLENRREIPFYFSVLNSDRSKVLMIERETIEKYPTTNKYDYTNEMENRVREIPLREGRGCLYGSGFGKREQSYFGN